MTREEASFYLANIERRVCDDETNEALDMAIKALEQEPCDDKINEWKKDFKEFVNSLTMPKDDYKGIIEYIDELPPVTPQQKMGRWLHRETMDYLDNNKVIHNHFMCQDCGFIHDFIDGHTAQYKYCPSCGAKMEVQDADSN